MDDEKAIAQLKGYDPPYDKIAIGAYEQAREAGDTIGKAFLKAHSRVLAVLTAAAKEVDNDSQE